MTFGAIGPNVNNALLSIPMLEENGFAVDAITHCVRHIEFIARHAHLSSKYNQRGTLINEPKRDATLAKSFAHHFRLV